jgi:outer membrane protein assembly factor BamB
MINIRLEDVASFVRNIGSECTLIINHNDNLIIGSNKGLLICWSVSSGIEKWRNSFEGPCSELVTDEEICYLTENGNVHSINLKNGEVVWSLELEGLSDFIQVNGEDVWVTSSTYDLHISNYSESIVWLINKNGDIMEKWAVEGKPWSLAITDHGVFIGLSRPKCGYAKISKNNNIEYVSLKNENPVTIGLEKDKMIFLGHSNGKVTVIDQEVTREIDIGKSAVSSLEKKDDLIIGLESGEIYSELNEWNIKLDGIIDRIVQGPSIEGVRFLWSSSWSNNSTICAIDINTGLINYKLQHNFRIRQMKSNGKILVLGDSDGKIFLIEDLVLNRRIKAPIELIENDEKRALLKDKLRSLRM